MSVTAYTGGDALRRYCPFAQDPECRTAVMRAIAMRHARLSLGYQVMQTPPRARSRRRQLQGQLDYIAAAEERDRTSTPIKCSATRWLALEADRTAYADPEVK